jgi:hypothetical protein
MGQLKAMEYGSRKALPDVLKARKTWRIYTHKYNDMIVLNVLPHIYRFTIKKIDTLNFVLK